MVGLPQITDDTIKHSDVDKYLFKVLNEPDPLWPEPDSHRSWQAGCKKENNHSGRNRSDPIYELDKPTLTR